MDSGALYLMGVSGIVKKSPSMNDIAFEVVSGTRANCIPTESAAPPVLIQRRYVDGLEEATGELAQSGPMVVQG